MCTGVPTSTPQRRQSRWWFWSARISSDAGNRIRSRLTRSVLETAGLRRTLTSDIAKPTEETSLYIVKPRESRKRFRSDDAETLGERLSGLKNFLTSAPRSSWEKSCEREGGRAPDRIFSPGCRGSLLVVIRIGRRRNRMPPTNFLALILLHAVRAGSYAINRRRIQRATVKRISGHWEQCAASTHRASREASAPRYGAGDGRPPSAFVKIEFFTAARPLPPSYPQRESKLD